MDKGVLFFDSTAFQSLIKISENVWAPSVTFILCTVRVLYVRDTFLLTSINYSPAC